MKTADVCLSTAPEKERMLTYTIWIPGVLVRILFRIRK